MTFPTSFVRNLLANATASEWMDAIVMSVEADGALIIATIDDNRIVRLTAPAPARPGEPVAVHARYGVIALGGRRYELALA